MRKLCLSFALFLCCLVGSAQTDFRFADATAVWHLKEVHYLELFQPPGGIDSQVYTGVHRVQKDTVIQGYQYQKINPGIYEEAIFMRNDSTGMVFLYDVVYQQEVLIYDFSLEQGDTFRRIIYYEVGGPDTMSLVVDSIDSVQLDTFRKRMFVRCIPDGACSWEDDDVWIEGIGSLNSYFGKPYWYEFKAIPGNRFKLLCFTENGVTYNFSNNCYVGVEEVASAIAVSLVPNPAHTHFGIQLNDPAQQIQTVQLYSVSGKEVLNMQTFEQTPVLNTQHLARGIYFCQVILSSGEQVTKKVVIE